MNERIRQLAEQAGLAEGVFTRHDGVPCDLKGYSMLPEEMEKFAELLVLHVLHTIDTANVNKHVATTYDSSIAESVRIELIKAVATEYGVKYTQVPKDKRMFPVRHSRFA